MSSPSGRAGGGKPRAADTNRVSNPVQRPCGTPYTAVGRRCKGAVLL